MGIIGKQPETGFRFELTRAVSGTKVRYEGRIALPDGDIPALAHVEPDGTVTVEFPETEPFRERLRLLLRSAVKPSGSPERPAPGPAVLNRWRAEK